MQETRVQSLGWEDPREKEMATHSSILVWKIPWTEEPARLQSMGSQRVGHDWVTSLFTFTVLHSQQLVESENAELLIQPTVKLHADFRPCSESAPITLFHCSRVNCTLLTTMQPGTMPLENLYPVKPDTYITYQPGLPVQFSPSTQSYPIFATQELQHARLPCPSPTPGVHPNRCPATWWCHPAVLSSVVPFSCPESFTASGSFPVR